MRLIVDGMNVIGSTPDGWWRDREGARLRLVSALTALAGRPEVTSVAVVFDGSPGRRETDSYAAGGVVAVSFAGRGADAADAVIAEDVAAAVSPESLTVVTSDQALATRVRSSGAAVMGVSGFRRMLAGR